MDLPADDDGPDFGEIVQYGNELEPLPELNTPSPQENTAESPQEDTEDTLPSLCCRKNCFSMMARCARTRETLRAMGHPAQQQWIMNRVAEMRVDGNTKWALLNERVCFRGWCSLLGLGKTRVLNLARGVAEGRPTPAMDGRTWSPGRPPEESNACDAHLEWLYQVVAEPLADVPREPRALLDEDDQKDGEQGKDRTGGQIRTSDNEVDSYPPSLGPSV